MSVDVAGWQLTDRERLIGRLGILRTRLRLLGDERPDEPEHVARSRRDLLRAIADVELEIPDYERRLVEE